MREWNPGMEYDGINGFLPGSRASIMLDVVFLAMFLVVPVLGWSIYLVRYRRNYALHKKLQLALAATLLIAVGLFEIDMQLMTDWEQRAVASPYYPREVWTSLAVHLCFAIPTFLLWIAVVTRALRRFPKPPAPSPHSASHVFWARLAALGMLLTAATGWVFYWLAFMA